MEYIDIPEDIKEMHKEEIIGAAHYSEIIRLELLTKYGGLWLDATLLLILEETLKLLYTYWRTEKRAINYFAMHFLFRTVSNVYYEEWKSVPYYPNSNCGLLQKEFDNVYNEKRIRQILNCNMVHKLTYKKNMTLENSVYSYILNNM